MAGPRMSAPSLIPISRRVYGLIGYVSLLLAAIGIILPLLPTVPFVLLSVWAFTRYDPAIADRIVRHPRFGPPLQDWREGGVISTRAKFQALLTLAASWIVIWMTSSGAIVPLMAGFVFGCAAGFILTRPSRSSACVEIEARLPKHDRNPGVRRETRNRPPRDPRREA